MIGTSYSFIDASTEGYEEEETYEEEENHFDHQPNQGKLLSMQAILVQASKDTIAIYLGNLTHPKFFILQAFTLLFIKVFL